MSGTDPYTDVVELCALLQCLGFSIKSHEHNNNISQEGGIRTVVINCTASGLHVEMESGNDVCSCPAPTQQQNSGFWQVSGITGGKQLDKEYGSILLGSLPKTHRERLTKELLEIVRNIKESSVSEVEKSKHRESLGNKSASMIDFPTPEKCSTISVNVDTPTRYRSLDTLTARDMPNQDLPEPGPLQRSQTPVKSHITQADQDSTKVVMCYRQSTYTLSSTPESSVNRNKTSSPIASSQILESLKVALKTTEDLRNQLRDLVNSNEWKHDTSTSSLVMDVSKISVPKGAEQSKVTFSSSPNLSGLGNASINYSQTKLKRRDSSASTSSLVSNNQTKKEGTISKLRRISPNMFTFIKDKTSMSQVEKSGSREVKNTKLKALFQQTTVTPNSGAKRIKEQSPNISSSKKYSHVKSTIPKPMIKKEKL